MITLVVMASVREFDPICTRLMCPAYPPLAIAALSLVWSLSVACWHRARSFRKVLRAPIVALALAVLGLMAVSAVASGWPPAGGNLAGYLERESTRFLRQVVPTERRLLSNQPHIVWYVTRKPTRFLADPRNPQALASLAARRVDGLIVTYRRKHLVFTQRGATPSDLHAAGILRQLETIRSFPDCEVLRSRGLTRSPERLDGVPR